MNNASDKVDQIFWDALQITSDHERRAFLDRACGDDGKLRQRVEKMLKAQPKAEPFLEKPFVVAPTIDQPITEKPGTVIDRYKLLEQEEPVRRKVALKIIKPGMDTKEVIARFEAERQALAIMDHPNIAKVLDAGATESGRPYFVMELVRGIPITDFCDQNSLPTRERLELFASVCQAVQHAHQKGIIHRDIKPSNVMVTLRDDTPAPKVIDFGVAKATNARLTDRTLFTRFGQIVGTPLYMSPEQAGMGELDIDTRSDIYSLGVLLYELLTGATPFDQQRIREAAYDELLKIIREEEPPKPSLRISSLGEMLPSVAANRKLEPKKLSALVRGELDWIVMKALEKDRTRRYETATSFVADIQRYLTDEPVQACPPSAAYRFKKFARRNKAALSTAAVVAVAIFLGIAATTWQAIRATNQRDRAVKAESLASDRYQGELEARRQVEEQRDRAVAAEESAKIEAAIARAVNEFLNQDLLSQADPGNEPHRDIKLRTVVDRAAERIEGRFVDQPLVEAAIHQTLGSTYLGLGHYEKAEQHYKRARKLRRRVLGPEHPGTLLSMDRLAGAILRQGQYAEAEKLSREALEIEERVLGPEHPGTLATITNLANAIGSQGQYAEAEKLHREALEIRQRVIGPEHPHTLGSMNYLAVAITSQRRYAEAEELYREVLEIQQRVLDPEHPDTLVSMNNLAGAILRQGQYAEAEKVLREVREIQQRVLGPEHPLALSSTNNLALAINGRGRHAEAEELYREALEIQQRVLGPEHPDTLMSIDNQAGAILRQGRYAEAEKLYRQVLKTRQRLLGPEHPATLQSLRHLVTAYTTWCWRLATAADPAERNAEEALELARKTIQLQPEIANHWNNLGVALYRTGDCQAAVEALEKADEMLKGKDRAHRFFRTMAHWRLGHREQAKRYYAEAVAWLEKQEQNEEQYRFRDEAEQLMGIVDKKSEEGELETVGSSQ